MGGVVGQNGTEQAFVYWETPDAQPGNVVLATPEPVTLYLALLVLFSLGATRRFKQSVVRIRIRGGQHLP
jgi:hypothetical protein